MTKMTLKDKAREGFMAALAMKNFADRLAQDAKDFGLVEEASLAKEMLNKAEEFLKKLR